MAALHYPEMAETCCCGVGSTSASKKATQVPRRDKPLDTRE